MRAVALALCALVTLACVVYVVTASRARAPLVDEPATRAVGEAPRDPPPPSSAPPPAIQLPSRAAAPEPAAPAAEPAAPSETVGELAARALVDLDDGDYEGARVAAERCLVLDRTRSPCQSALVSSFTRRGQWDLAHPHLVECLRNDPGNAVCMSSMTLYDLQKGRLDDAKRMLDTLTSADRDHASTQLAAAEYAEATHDHDGACAHFRAACDLGQSTACLRQRQLCRPPKIDN